MRHRIIEEIEKYVNQSSTGRDLEEWLLSNLQEILISGEAEAIALVNEVNALYAELSEDLLSEDEFEDNITSILRREEQTVSFTIGRIPVQIIGQSTVKKKLIVPGNVRNEYLEFQFV